MKNVIGVFDDKVLIYDNGSKTADYVSLDDFRSMPSSECVYYRSAVAKYKTLYGVDITIRDKCLSEIVINTDCPLLDFNNFYVVFGSKLELINNTNTNTHLVFSRYSVIPDDFEIDGTIDGFTYDVTNLETDIIYKSFSTAGLGLESYMSCIQDKPERYYACLLKYNLGSSYMQIFKDNVNYIESYFKSALSGAVYVFSDTSDLAERFKEDRLGSMVFISGALESSSLYRVFRDLAHRLYNKSLASDVLFLLNYNYYVGGTSVTEALEKEVVAKFLSHLGLGGI